MEKNLFLTGCCGFIGINFLRYVYESGLYKNYKYIYNLDKYGYATVFNRDEYNQLSALFHKTNVSCFTSVLMDSEQFSNVYKFMCRDVNTRPVDIVDFASESHVDNSISNPNQLFLDNCRIPGDLYSVFKDKIDNFYHISTDEVYGDIPLNERDDVKRYFTPYSTLHPSNPYAASKAAQDMYLNSIYKTFSVPVTIIRMANQFGLHQHPEKMIPASIMRALKGESIKIYGEGKNCRQWTFVEDTVKAIGAVMSHESDIMSLTRPPLVHLADEKNLMDNNQLIQCLAVSLKRHNVDVKIEYVTDRLGHDQMYALHVADEQKKFFVTPFTKALDKTVDSYVEGFKNARFT